MGWQSRQTIFPPISAKDGREARVWARHGPPLAEHVAASLSVGYSTNSQSNRVRLARSNPSVEDHAGPRCATATTITTWPGSDFADIDAAVPLDFPRVLDFHIERT
jgi:hypothetical protein